MKNQIFEEIDGQLYYRVPQTTGPVSGCVQVPGSKSVTNRDLLLAALSQGKCELEGVLFSEDSRHFIHCLTELGFQVEVEEEAKRVSIWGMSGEIPRKEGQIYVGSAGTAARFLTAMLALSQGEYTIQCSSQMKSRPMKPLFQGLAQLGAEFTYLEEEYHLPVIVKGTKVQCKEISLDISKSTQFLSGILMLGPMIPEGLTINITSEKSDGSYIRVTRSMVSQFQGEIHKEGSRYRIPEQTRFYAPKYEIEPDVSAACYFYAIALLTGGEIQVKGLRKDLMQGDMRFLEVLENLGGCIIEKEDGIALKGPKDGVYPGISVDMNDFSDQTMTLAALSAYGTSPTKIKGVAHIRLQECDRMQATADALNTAGITCELKEDEIFISPGPLHGGIIETWEDHRIAMAFTLLGLKTKDILIKDPLCCKKTFENYFEVLSKLLEER